MLNLHERLSRGPSASSCGAPPEEGPEPGDRPLRSNGPEDVLIYEGDACGSVAPEPARAVPSCAHKARTSARRVLGP